MPPAAACESPGSAPAVRAACLCKLPGKKAACELFSELQLDGGAADRGYSLCGMGGLLVRADVPPVRRRLRRVDLRQEGAMGARGHGAGGSAAEKLNGDPQDLIRVMPAI